ncbi:kinase-like domain-containing protein [Apiospora sp. TS-2023a]
MGTKFIENVRLYFANDARYECEGSIGQGAYGAVFKIRDNQAAESPGQQRFALKFPFAIQFPSGEDNWISETQVLSAFQAAAHVVNRIALTDDPLRNPPQDARKITSDWIYLEYLENGTFKQMAARLRMMNRPIPNRFIWRITLCLIRMCIAMAWPNPYATGAERIEELEQDFYTHIISNVDLHDENMMFGSLNSDGSLEHQLTPILKMIDMGECQRQRTRGESQWLMKTAVLLDGISDHVQILVDRALRTSEEALPVDPELSDLATLSLGDQPDIRELAAGVIAAVTTRTETWYRARYPGIKTEQESDASVRDFVNALFFDAVPMPTLSRL